ncbi:hypothetical protein P5V15_005363 [Pogonomyrmex californicus]
MKINYSQLPIKAHYFFFMAAMGPIVPYLSVYGKQLGVSSVVIGSIVAILPIAYLIATIIFGYIADYFNTWRKAIFMTILVLTTVFYIFLYFLPSIPEPILPDHPFQNISCESLQPCDESYYASKVASCNDTKNTICHWMCKDTNFSTRLSFHAIEKEAIISSNTTCLLSDNETSFCQRNITTVYNCNVTCDNFKDDDCLYVSITFWGFVIFMSLGNTFYYISLTITDAICFDVLGENERLKYGKQRLWGSVGYCLTALLSGYAIDLWSQGKVYKDYTPAFIIMLVLFCFDLVCCKKLKLPQMLNSTNILKDVCAVLKLISIIIFLCFAILSGILESFTIFFLFWYVEDLAMVTGYMSEVKLIEGLIVAAAFLGSKIIFFFMAGKILTKFGYGYTLTFTFACYMIRLILISVVPTPWYIVLVEVILQGPSYALNYSTIVMYASIISPHGTSATVQGITAGMKEGVGYAIGGFTAGILYRKIGGRITLRIYAGLAGLCMLMFFVIYTLYLKQKILDTKHNVEWRKPDDAQRHCVVAET